MWRYRVFCSESQVLPEANFRHPSATDLQEQLISEFNDGKAVGNIEHFLGPIPAVESCRDG